MRTIYGAWFSEWSASIRPDYQDCLESTVRLLFAHLKDTLELLSNETITVPDSKGPMDEGMLEVMQIRAWKTKCPDVHDLYNYLLGFTTPGDDDRSLDTIFINELLGLQGHFAHMTVAEAEDIHKPQSAIMKKFIDQHMIHPIIGLPWPTDHPLRDSVTDDFFLTSTSSRDYYRSLFNRHVRQPEVKAVAVAGSCCRIS